MPDYNVYDGEKAFQLRSVDPTEVGDWIDGELVYKFPAVERATERIDNLVYDVGNGTFRAMTATEITDAKTAAARAAALAENEFDRGDVVDALITLGKWEALKAILNTPGNEQIKDRWETHQTIKLDDPDVLTVLAALELNVDTVKLQIAGLNGND